MNVMDPDMANYCFTGGLYLLQRSQTQRQTRGTDMIFFHTICGLWDGCTTTYLTGGELSHQKRDVHPVLIQCWATVCDAGPTLNLHRVNVPLECHCSVLYLHTNTDWEMTQCWFYVGPSSATLAQHWTNIRYENVTVFTTSVSFS